MLITMELFLFLFELCFKNYGRPNTTVPKYNISRKARFYVHCNYFVPRSVNAVVVLSYAANTALDRSGDLQSWRTTVYSEKPSSMATTHCDMENQVFLATHCDNLHARQGLITLIGVCVCVHACVYICTCMCACVFVHT